MKIQTFVATLACFSCLITDAQLSFKSENLEIVQLSPNVFLHISFLPTENFGRVACNGLIITNEGSAIVVDAPVYNTDAEMIMKWIKNELHCEIQSVVATHFHNDCIGGLEAFHAMGISSYAHQLTLDLLAEKKGAKPQKGFTDYSNLKLAEESIVLHFLGEGHTKDNIVVYFPKEKVLFGGCLVKATNAPKGFLGDANTEAWPNTIKKLKATYPEARIVVPGHGNPGGLELLDYTVELFERQ